MNMDLKLFLPEIIIFLSGTVILIADLFMQEKNKKALGLLAETGSILAIVQLVNMFVLRQSFSSELFTIDPFSHFIKIILLLSTGLVILLSIDYFKKNISHKGEYYCLILFSVTGMMFMVSASNFISFFLSLQLTSIPLYILSGIDKNDARSNEAAYKYLMLGMLASVVMLYGMTFVYGFSGACNFEGIAWQLSNLNLHEHPVLLMSMIFIFAGFAFKVAAVPFHFWVPDTYEGAPTPVTSFLATAPKVAGFAALIRLVTTAFSPLISQWRILFGVLSIMSMCVGNLVALSQTNIKRMLGFSSIAHVGYILMAFAVADRPAFSAAIFYLMIYGIVNIGTFAVIAAVMQGEDHHIQRLAGLSKKSPLMSLSIAVFFISMIGIPPTPGFWGKFDLFASAINRGMTWLAVVGIINSIISVSYYINVLRYVYADREGDGGVNKGVTAAADGLKIPCLMKLVVGIALALTIIIATYPEPFIEIARAAAIALKTELWL
ncbi:MAG: NADH-quinone oxidoreductase subunit N [bacterium]